MDSIVNLIVGDLVVSPEYVLVVRLVAFVLCVEVLSSLLSAIVPLVRSIR